MMEWSEMLPELVDIIAQKYITFYEDYPSFAGVCKSWRLAAARTYDNSNGPPSRLPSLMLADKSEDDKESLELFLLSNKSIREIRLPEAYGKLCMSSCGWLLTVGDDFATQLVNPLSLETINLPKVDTLQEERFFGEQELEPLDWDMQLFKLVLVIPANLVFVICGSKGKLAFCHIGDKKWTYVEEGRSGQIYDITFYNGQVYAICWYNNIRACNVNGKEPTVFFDVTTMPEDVCDQVMYSAYIIGLDDEERKRLLVIIREYETTIFQVFAYDLESGNWSKVKDLGTKTLFVGYSSLFCVEETTGVIKGNCIYYTDDVLSQGRDMGIYHLSDGTIEPHFEGESCSHLTPPIWLQ
ncbi:hypothetical protein Tco_0641473 [Tanacetum coccineum]